MPPLSDPVDTVSSASGGTGCSPTCDNFSKVGTHTGDWVSHRIEDGTTRDAWRALQRHQSLPEEAVTRAAQRVSWEKNDVDDNQEYLLRLAVVGHANCSAAVLATAARTSREASVLMLVCQHPNSSDETRTLAALRLDSQTGGFYAP